VTVHLVGAGPGDPELLTRRAARLLAVADVVVHDALIDPGVLDLARDGAEIIDVGKRPGRPVPQELITALLVELGRRHAVVVRLKGGDPYVFGRGGEEARGLIDAGVAAEVVPGVSSAFGVPALAGVPVTHRGSSAAVTVVTGHRRAGAEAETDWEALARVGGTIVVLMGVAERASIAERLRAGGLPATTPVAVVERGTRSDERVRRCHLDELAGVDVEPPATIVIGTVAALDLRSAVVATASSPAAGVDARL
jgi:uroporphyrin-III C-methyltransferase